MRQDKCNFGHNTAEDTGTGGADGGALVFDGTSAKLIRCNFVENNVKLNSNSIGGFAGAAYLRGPVDVINCVFSANYIADGNDDNQGAGGACLASKEVAFTNTLIYDNHALEAGAIFILDHDVSLFNCTMTRNSATGTNSCGGLFDSGNTSSSGSTIYNSIFWGNTGGAATTEVQQINLSGQNGAFVVQHNIIEGRIASGQFDSNDDVLNLPDDPMFYDEPHDNFRLLSCSSGIDYGDTRQMPIDTLNVRGALGSPTSACSGCGGNRVWDLDLHYRVADMPKPDNVNSVNENLCQRCLQVIDLGSFERTPLGDLNFDGVINGLDIQPFTDCMIAFPSSTPNEFCMNADMNEDLVLNFNDVTCFIRILLGQTGCIACGPGFLLVDCNENEVADAIDIREGDSQDCNGNGIPDECDIASETSNDVNANGVPDECEPDCNGNHIPDAWDISESTSGDVDSNEIPDECEPDCNGNDLPDDYDISTSSSPDCNSNGVPDECEYDCNSNGVPDDCDIDPLDPDGDKLVSEDCNENGIPDECDLARSVLPSFDCNDNNIPDECELAGNDSNENGILDECEKGGRSMMEGGGGGGEFDEAAAWELFYEWYEEQINGTPGDWSTLSGSERFERVMDELDLLGLPIAPPW